MKTLHTEIKRGVSTLASVISKQVTSNVYNEILERRIQEKGRLGEPTGVHSYDILLQDVILDKFEGML